MRADLVDGPTREAPQMRAALGLSVAVVVLFTLMSAFTGTLDVDDGEQDFSSMDWRDLPLEERWRLEVPTNGSRSVLPDAGPYEALEMSEHFVTVDLPASEQDVGAPGPALMHVALWLPDVPEGVTVPVIATIHPYYDFGGEGIVGEDSNPNTIPDAGVGAWVHEQFVPHGYALAQVSTFGTGQSTHCQDVKGLGEQVGIQAAVEWLGTQSWSNGHVGLMGKSYAGTTNWEAAQNPSEHLKTIVPISGSIGVQQMFYRNGSSESRAMLYDVLYEAATADATADDLRMCTDDVVGPLAPWSTWAGAEFGGADWSDYWEERYHLQDVIDNYDGSVYLVWGLQDWNVDPYHAFPTHQMLVDAGINIRTIAGQWAHNYPDQPEVHANAVSSGYGEEALENMSRMDWAVELFIWFEHYLKGIGPEPESLVHIQTNDGRWHIESTWPPEDMGRIDADLSEWSQQGAGIGGPALSTVTLTSPPLEEDLHLSGLPELSVGVVTRTCQGGQVFATLRDATAGLRLGHATMDVRYRGGGYDALPTAPLTPYVLPMEFNPLDVRVPAGHVLELILSESGEDYLPSPCAHVGLQYVHEDSSFTLHVIERPDDASHWIDVLAGTR